MFGPSTMPFGSVNVIVTTELLNGPTSTILFASTLPCVMREGETAAIEPFSFAKIPKKSGKKAKKLCAELAKSSFIGYNDDD